MSDTPSSPTETVYISADTGFSGYKLRNFYITNAIQGFTWMLFHFTIIYFFTILLNNIFLTGLFLGFANFMAFLLDIPLGILQKYISTKKYFIYGAISQLIAVGIFLMMIFHTFEILNTVGGQITPDFLDASRKWFFGSFLNIFLLLIASVCYGLTKEINEVSTFGYILSNSNPSEYGIILSRSNITFGVGSIFGLVLSGVLLSLPNMISLIILGMFIVGFLVFTIRFFDNSLDSVTIENIKAFKVSLGKFNVENVREYLSSTIKNTDLKAVVESTKYIFLKPKQLRPANEKIPWGSLIGTTRSELQIIWQIITSIPLQYALIWGLALVLIFGFWDTFATSFLVDYLDQISPGYSYVLLAIIGVPGVVLQEPMIRLSRRIGIKSVGFLGLILSAISLLFMAIMAIGEPPTLVALLFVALVNSIGYAGGMAIGQSTFLEKYNQIYAESRGLKEIDANASAGPIKVVQNLANVIGLLGGGLILGFGFPVFFFAFTALIVGTLIWSIRHRAGIVL